jgi:2-phosphosulfolactate phosphatase
VNTRIVLGADGARAATGVVVVIDVMRAFTTAAYAFGAGIGEIELVATVDEALASPGFRMGEVGGRLIPGFDHDNSPSRLVGRRLDGRAVMRTGSGTRCVAEARNASEIWLGSLVVASATVRALADCTDVTFVASGAPHEGEEDVACAELMAASLSGGGCQGRGGQSCCCETPVRRRGLSTGGRRLCCGDRCLRFRDEGCARGGPLDRKALLPVRIAGPDGRSNNRLQPTAAGRIMSRRG